MNEFYLWADKNKIGKILIREHNAHKFIITLTNQVIRMESINLISF